MPGVTDQINHRNIGLSPSPPHKAYFILFPCLLEYIDITQVLNKTVEDCLLYHLLEYEKEAPASRERFQTYFVAITYLKKVQENACTSFIMLQKYSKQRKLSLESGEK